jgi:hypothetical protein
MPLDLRDFPVRSADGATSATDRWALEPMMDGPHLLVTDTG